MAVLKLDITHHSKSMSLQVAIQYNIRHAPKIFMAFVAKEKLINGKL